MSVQSDEAKANTQPHEFVDGQVKVVVRVIKAVDLKCEGKEPEKINAYVAVTLGSDESQRYKTKPIKHNPNPEWDEKFEFSSNDLENEVIYVDMKSKGKQKSTTIMKRVKISFVSFTYGETKEVEKELHWKDQYVGRLYLEISLKGKGRKKSTGDIKTKSPKKTQDPGLCFKVNVVSGKELEDGEYCVQLKMKNDDNSNPVTSSKQGTKPKWNEDLYIKTKDASNDTLQVNLLKNGKKCIDPIEFETGQYSVGQDPINFDGDVYKKKNKVGHLKLKVTPLDYNTKIDDNAKYDLNVDLIDCDGYSKDDEPITCDLQINGRSIETSKGSKKLKWNERYVLPFNNLKKDVFTIKPSKGDAIAIPLNTMKLGSQSEYTEEVPNTNDCTIHFKLEPVEHGKIKERSLGGNKCTFSLGDYSSEFSTTFTSLTSSFQQSVSELRSDEDNFHPHAEVEPDQEEKPCRYDNVKGSLKSLSDLVDIGGSSSQIYVTLDVLSMGKAKKAKTKKSKKCDPSETPDLSFDLQNIKKGNTLVFNIWRTGDSSDVNIGVVEIPVKDIPENKDKKLTREIQEPANFTYGEQSSFGKASFQLNHTVDYRLPYDNDED